MSDSPLSPPRIAFLGVCERAALVREGHQVLWRHNLLGLRQVLVNYFTVRLNKSGAGRFAFRGEPQGRTFSDGRLRLWKADRYGVVTGDFEFSAAHPSKGNSYH